MKKIIALLLMFGVLFTANAVTSTRTVSIEFDVDKPTTMSFNISNVVQGDPLTINWAAKEGSEAADLSLVDGIKFYIKDYPESSIIAYSNAIITNPTNGVGTVSFISQQMRFENYVANVEIVAQFGDLNERTLAQGLINLSQQFVTGTEDNWNPPTGYTLGQALLSGNNAQGLDIENLDDILLNRILLTNTDVISAGIWSSSRDISIIPRDKFDVTGEIETDSITVLSTIDLPDKSITNSMIADNAITSSKFETGSVGDDALADTLIIPYLSVSGGLTLPDGDIVASDIGEGQVNTFHIEDNSITANDLATNSVGDLELQDTITINSLTVPGSISIPAASIGPEEIALSAIGSSHIADNIITQDDIADDAVGSGELQDAIEVADLSVTNNISIPKNSIGNNELVDSIQLSWLEVTDIIDIPLGSIGTDDIASDIEIRNLTVSESISLPPGVNIDLELGAGSVSTAELADDAVTADKLADNAVVSSSIVDGSISDVDLANDYIRADVDDSVSGTLTLTKPTLLVEQGSSPGAPQPGFAMVYALDNNLYYKNDQGVEYSLIATGGGEGAGTLEETLLLGNDANGQSITGLASLSSGTIEVDGVLYADTIVSKNQVSTYDNTLTDSYLYGEKHVLEAVRGNSLDYVAGTHEEAGESTAVDSMLSINSFGSNDPLIEITGSKIYDGLFNIYDSTGGSFFMWSNQRSDSDKVAVIDIGENDSWIPVKDAFGGVGVAESGGNVFGSIPDASADGENSAIGWSYKPSNTFFGKENVTTFVDGTGKEGSYAVNGVDAIDDASITMGLFKPLVNQDGNTTFDSSVGDFFLTREYLTKEDFSAIYNSGSGINPFAYANPEHLLVYYAGNGEPSNYYDGDNINGFYSWPYSANIIGDKWSAGEDYLWNTNAIPVSGSVVNNPSLWLDASTLLHGTPDGGDVSVWEDRSGNGYNATSISGIDALLDYDGIGGMASVTFTTNTVYRVDSGLTYARDVYSVTDGIAPEFIRNAIRIDDGSGDNAIWSGDGFAMDPVKLGNVDGVDNLLDDARGVAVSPDGNYVYAASSVSSAMVIIDVTDKSAPVKLGHVAGGANMLAGAYAVAVSPDGNYVYVAASNSDAMVIIDVTDKSEPVKLGHVNGVANMLDSAYSVAVSPDGNYVYVAALNSDAIVIIDVTDKSAPVKLGHVAGGANMLDGARGVAVSQDGNYVYVAAAVSNAMVIIDVTDKSAPVKLGHVAGAANLLLAAHGVAVSQDGNYVYVASLDSDSLVIIDATNKNAPVKLGHVNGVANLLDGAHSVAVSPDGNYVYIAAAVSDAMVIIDATNKNAPVKLWHLGGVANLLDGAVSAAVSPDGNYVYIAAAVSDAMVIIDIFKGIVYDGNISEIVTSGNNLSNDDSYKVEGYLANKYSVSLPEGHIYKYHAPFAPKFGTTVQLFNTVDGIMEASGTAKPNSDIAGFPVTIDDGKSTVRAYINDGYIDTDGYRTWDDDTRTFVVTTGASGEVAAGVKNMWLPSMLGEDVALWLDAYSLVDIYDNGDEVTLWEDRFIGAYKATVPTAGDLYEKYMSLPDGDAKSSLVAEFGRYIESETGIKIIKDDPIIDDPIIDDPIIDDPIIKEPILKGEGLDTGGIEGGDIKPMSAEATSPTGPTFVIDGLNGKPTLMFDGTEFMVVSDLTLSSDATIFAVSNAAALSPLRDNPLFGATEAYFEYSTSSAAQYGIHMDSISGVTSASDYSADNISSVVWDAGVSLGLYRNGELVGIDEAVSVSTSFTSLELGRYIGNYHTGDLSEIIIFDRALTTIERQMVEGYLGNKYGISLISGHPYESEAPEGGSGALNQFQVVESMIRNGNFEAWSTASPSAWTASNVTKETSYVNSGNNSARLDASLGGSTLESSPVQMQSGAYALTCMARSNGSGGVLRLGWNNNVFTQAYRVGHNHVDKSLTNKWERMSFVTALSDNISSGSFVAEATSGVVYIDDVSVVRLTDLSPEYTPGGIGWRGFNGIGEISGWVYAPFVGTHDKLTADARDINGKEGSISIWISPYDDISTPGHVFECGDLKVTRLADGTIKAIANGGDVESVSTSVITKDEWSNIVIVWDESSQYLYVDGVLEDTDAISSNMDLVNTIHVGTGVDGNGFGGYIANVAFWDRALTADQALAVATSNHAVVGQIAPTEKPLRRVAKYIALNDIQRGDAVILIDGETVSTTSSVDNPLFEGIATDNAIAGDYVWVGVGGVFEANSSAEIAVGDYLGTSIIDGELTVTSTPPAGSSSAIAVSVVKDGNVSVLIR